jgi:hypothetical protein
VTNGAPPESEKQPPPDRFRFDSIAGQFWLYFGLFILELYVLLNEDLTKLATQRVLGIPKHLLLGSGALMFGSFAAFNAIAYFKRWSDKQASEMGSRFVWWIIKSIGAVLAICIAGVAIYLGFDWFSSIPSWAAVIIVLLVILVLSRE